MFFHSEKKSFALYIDDETIQVLQLKGDVKNIRIDAIGSKDLPNSTILDGEVKNEKEFISTIKELLKSTKPNRISEKDCTLVLPEQQSYEFVFYLQKDQKVVPRSLVEKNLGDNLPINIRELSYDFMTYRLDNLEILFTVAIRKSVLEQYRKILTGECGLNITSVEPASISLLRNLQSPIPESEGAVLIYVSNKRLIWFLLLGRTIFDSNRASMENISQLQQDLLKSIKFFELKTQKKIKNIFVTGGLVPDNFIDELSKYFNISVTRCHQYGFNLEEIAMAKFGLNEGDASSGKFHILIGAALKNIEGTDQALKINLLKSGK